MFHPIVGVLFETARMSGAFGVHSIRILFTAEQWKQMNQVLELAQQIERSVTRFKDCPPNMARGTCAFFGSVARATPKRTVRSQVHRFPQDSFSI